MSKPLRTGWTDQGTAEQRAPLSLTEFDFSSGIPLDQAEKDYTFFTPALLYLSTPLPFGDLTSEYEAVRERALHVSSRKFDHMIFNGLMAPNKDMAWNHVLFAMPREEWDDFYAWCGTLAFNVAATGRLHRVRWQTRTIAEPISVARGQTINNLTIQAIWIETNAGSFFLGLPALADPQRRPVATFDKDVVYDDTCTFASRLKVHDANPYGVPKL